MNYLFTGTIILGRNMTLRDRTCSRVCPRRYLGIRLCLPVQMVTLGNKLVDNLHPAPEDRQSRAIVGEITFYHLRGDG